MPVLMINYQVPDEGVADVTRAIEAAFAAVHERHPEGLRFAYYRRADSADFIGVLELDEDMDNPLYGIEAARDLQATVTKWLTGEPPAPQPYTLIGAYDAAK